jgi:hypothetical protein
MDNGKKGLFLNDPSTFIILILMAMELLDRANESPWWVIVATSFVFAVFKKPQVNWFYVRAFHKPFFNQFFFFPT